MVLSEVMALRLLRLRIDAAMSRVVYLIERYENLAQRSLEQASRGPEHLRDFYVREAENAARVARILKEFRLSLSTLADLADKGFRRMTEYEAEELLSQIANLKMFSTLPHDVALFLADLETSLHEYLKNDRRSPR